MGPRPHHLRLFGLFLIASGCLLAQGNRAYSNGAPWWNAGSGSVLPWDENYDNPDGQVSIKNRKGVIRTKDHAFFDPLGTNGRACVTCHQPSAAMSISVAVLRDRWVESNGKDPVFAAFDGSDCPSLPQAAAASHSLLLTNGLFRIPLPWPPKANPNPEFKIEVISDRAGCNQNPTLISVYRRPRMTANLEYVLAGPGATPVFMADGREPSLESQATNAILGHEQAHQGPTNEQLRQIVEFEKQIYAAQNSDIRMGLFGDTALGAENLAQGRARTLAIVAASFDPWRKPSSGLAALQRETRTSAARGSEIFFGRVFEIRKVAGQQAESGTCATCHSAGTTRWMDIGTTNRETLEGLPVFKITCDAGAAPHPYLGRVITTQDPGRALITGKCADVGSIVLQQFRGLPARAPYFVNGSAKDLDQVIEFYDQRFGIHYSEQEKRDLANFLRVL